MGIFSSDPSARQLFTLYSARLTFRDRLLGGVPKSADTIEGWIRSKAGVSDAMEIRHALAITMADLGQEPASDSLDDIIEASKKLASDRSTTGFKRDDNGLFIESRQLKAAIKESVNILYAGQRVGATKKGPRSYTAERVFVAPLRLHLGRTEPDGIDLLVGHVTGPQGPRSTLSYHEYVEGASLDFTVMVAEDAIPADWWPRLWTLMEMNGIGAVRSQGNGTFDLVRWDKLGVPTQEQFEAITRADALLMRDRHLGNGTSLEGRFELARQQARLRQSVAATD